VASDGSTKLPARITGAVQHHTARGLVPRGLALIVAAYVRCLATPGAYDAAALGAVADARRDELEELGRRSLGAPELVAAVFELGIFAAALREATAFVEAVAELHAVLVAHGHRGAIEAAIG
jgi:mannitol-1-phosphate/altronate dehydrogenase